MYSSNSFINSNDLISYPIQFYSSRPFSIESNPTQLETPNTSCALVSPPLSFFHFPSLFEEDQHDIFLEQYQHHLLNHQQSINEAEKVNVNMENISIIADHKAGQGTDPQIPIRRSSKGDRHSKIKTAKGLRDRRMRLSLLVAKRFFGLQDMLGFDKASKTVDWLLNQAKVEIKKVAREKNIHHHHHHHHVKSASSTSECTEAVSSLDEVAVSGNHQKHIKGVTKRRRVKVCRKIAFKHIGKESREKARERARERTKQKMRSQFLAEPDKSKQCEEATNDNLLSLGSCWNPFETVEGCAGTQSQSVDPSWDVINEVEERNSQGMEHLRTEEGIEQEDSLVIMSKWSPTTIFNYSLTNSGILQEHHFSEFQSMGKPWEPYNNHNI
ncbi:hypothetical protein TanjilG_13302 [Lupinus angustifolius]|uniref:TCP domain-containing protein n=1 Tax=Lupinus angustifolius TaxID=3871 RepID=A0A4P1RU20_LUPAN|nr:PREDICTED: transcription factor TCP18-like [Lupinus angustifolius]OIW18550.1 hypothetical protein TanjilG_13302 [Lupinus angustifolius]